MFTPVSKIYFIAYNSPFTYYRKNVSKERCSPDIRILCSVYFIRTLYIEIRHKWSHYKLRTARLFAPLTAFVACFKL